MATGWVESATGGVRTYVIAEMAWAHNGSLDFALQLVAGSREAGADAIGIHVTSLRDYMVPSYQCVDGVTTSGGGGQKAGEIYRYLERLNLSSEQWERIFRKARAVGLHLCVMCNDEPSLDFVLRFDPEVLVIAAACFTEYNFVRRIGRSGKTVVLRIGGATSDEVASVVEILRTERTREIVLLHGIQLYPTESRALNVSALRGLQQRFGCRVGLADHVDGGIDEALALPLLALAYGATVLEKHVTVDRALRHEDFEAALGLAEFRRFVHLVRQAEAAIGDGSFGALSDADRKYRRVSRKKTVARRAIARGALVKVDDIAFKRSDRGLDPGEAAALVGRQALVAIQADEGLDLTNCR